MLRKRFSLRDSQVKSHFEFELRAASQPEPQPQERPSMFRDPAALPFLERITDGLRMRGYSPTPAKTGAACHGAFRLDFPNLSVTVILFVKRADAMVKFCIRTWPWQSFSQRFRYRVKNRPTFPEWDQLCSAINDALVGEIRPESLRWMTFPESLEHRGMDHRDI